MPRIVVCGSPRSASLVYVYDTESFVTVLNYRYIIRFFGSALKTFSPVRFSRPATQPVESNAHSVNADAGFFVVNRLVFCSCLALCLQPFFVRFHSHIDNPLPTFSSQTVQVPTLRRVRTAERRTQTVQRSRGVVLTAIRRNTRACVTELIRLSVFYKKKKFKKKL